MCEHLSISEAEALDLIDLSVTLAKEARQKHVNDRELPIVAGSVGPYGACQHDGSEYHGNYVDHMTTEELVEWHRPRVGQLLVSGADILACETIPAKVKDLEPVRIYPRPWFMISDTHRLRQKHWWLC